MLRVTVIAVAVAALAAPAAVSGAAPGEPTAVRTMLLRQATLLKQAKWREMYAMYTQRFRRSCPYARFVRQGRQTRQLLGTRFQLRGIQVRVETPMRAIVAYRFVRDGQTLAAVAFRHRDVYTKIRGRWLDELDRVSAC